MATGKGTAVEYRRLREGSERTCLRGCGGSPGKGPQRNCDNDEGVESVESPVETLLWGLGYGLGRRHKRTGRGLERTCLRD